MTPAEVAATLRQFNGWRRDFDDKFEQPDPHEVSEAIDAAIAMIDRLEAAEKSDAESIAMYRKARDERDALRAKIEAMEKQEPVASIYIDGGGQREFDDWNCDLPTGSNLLYALPGAQPATSVPDGWREGVESAARLIDQKAELYAIRFGRDDIGGLSFGQGPHAEIKMDHYTRMIRLADEVRATLAASPEAKP